MAFLCLTECRKEGRKERHISPFSFSLYFLCFTRGSKLNIKKTPGEEIYAKGRKKMD